jgi:hypothetical protein
MSFAKFLLTEAEKKVNFKTFATMSKAVEGQIKTVEGIIDGESFKQSGNANLAGLLNKLVGNLVKVTESLEKIAVQFGEQKVVEKEAQPFKKKIDSFVKAAK